MTITGKPTATTWTYIAHVGRKTGTSDPIPNNCTIPQAKIAFLQAYQRAGVTIPANKLTPAILSAITQDVTAARSRIQK